MSLINDPYSFLYFLLSHKCTDTNLEWLPLKDCPQDQSCVHNSLKAASLPATLLALKTGTVISLLIAFSLAIVIGPGLGHVTQVQPIRVISPETFN